MTGDVWNGTMAYTDGSAVTFAAREEPKLYVENGRMEAMFNVVLQMPGFTSYVMSQAIKTTATPPGPPGPSPPGPPPPAGHCNKTAWSQFCPPTQANPRECMVCSEAHSAELFEMKCVGPDCWPDYCAGKPTPGCVGHDHQSSF